MNETSPMSTSIVRTVVPMLVGLVVSRLPWLDENVATEVVTVVVSSIYYVAARFLEEKLGPEWGWLLGRPSAPTYDS